MSPVRQVRDSSGPDGPTLVDQSYRSQQGTVAAWLLYGQSSHTEIATQLGTEQAAA
jgi:hypothetical protein